MIKNDKTAFKRNYFQKDVTETDQSQRDSGPRRALPLLVLLILMAYWLSPQPALATPPEQGEKLSAPVLAYYYIWFDPSSWDRAKTDYPMLGRYSSDDSVIMAQHVQWAKRAGIDGFIVSWKSTDKLNSRLEKLAKIAERENFKLSIIYQGLDFERDPLPIEKVVSDLEYFLATYLTHPAFDMFQKPVYIWSGTWKFSREEVERVSQTNNRQVHLLASEKNVAGYEHLADLVDGDAYYWSSVNPDTQPNYADKLISMANAIHERNGLWIAPAAPGFDARLIGGTRNIERKNGEMLLRQLENADKSAPDAIGLISWNEFSENSHIEPSEVYGAQELEVLAERQGRILPPIVKPTTRTIAPTSITYAIPLMSGMVLLVVLGIVIIMRRPPDRSGPKLLPPPPPDPQT